MGRRAHPLGDTRARTLGAPHWLVLIGLGACLVGSSSEVRAEPTVWQRAKNPIPRQEREALQATERVLFGWGDDMDLLRARAALVSLSRGTIKSPRLILRLIQLRRELHHSPARNTEELFAYLETRDLEPSIQSEVQRERAFFLVVETPDRAIEALDRALQTAWHQDLRAEILTFRGLLRLSSATPEKARGDFAWALLQGGDRSTRVEALLGLSLSEALEGRIEAMEEAAVRAYLEHNRRNTVSGSDPVREIRWNSELREAAHVIYLLGEAAHYRTTNPERMRFLQVDLCEQLRPVEDTASLSGRIRALLEPTCSALSSASPKGAISDPEKRR